MKVVLVQGGDWTGLYIDGELAVEDHSLSDRQVLNALSIKYSVREADDEWLSEHGSLPDKLKDVKWIKN